jgi:Trp operon repressor
MERAMDAVNEIKAKEETAKQVQQALRDKISSITRGRKVLERLEDATG